MTKEAVKSQRCCAAAHIQLKLRLGRMTRHDDMEVQVSLATTGEHVYSSAYSEVNDLRVWELRLHICHELAIAKYFSVMLFRGLTSWMIHHW